VFVDYTWGAVTSLLYLVSCGFNEVFYVDGQTMPSDQYANGLDVPTRHRYLEKLNESLFSV
jgi:hypothetical protein